MTASAPPLPTRLNADDATARLLAYDWYYREHPWPAPFDRTHQWAIRGDARAIPLAASTAGLVLTHPPYFDLKRYAGDVGGRQLAHRPTYDAFLQDLDAVLRACFRILVPGGRVCCVAGDILRQTTTSERHRLLPLPHDIMARARHLGFEVLTPILWGKVANRNGTEGRSIAFQGRPYQPNGVISSRFEYIVLLRKPGYRRVSLPARGLSMLQPDEVATWQQGVWSDVAGVGAHDDHPAPLPETIAYRLIRMFSFAGDWVVDPFAGIGTTLKAAERAGRNAIGVEAVPSYIQAMADDDVIASPVAASNAPSPGASVAECAANSATTQRVVYLDEPAMPPPSTAEIVWRLGASPLEAIAEMRSQDVLWVRDVWRHCPDVEAMQELVVAIVGRNLHLRAEIQGIDTRTHAGAMQLEGFRALAIPPRKSAGRRPKLDAAAVERARAMRADGTSLEDIAAAMGVHRTTMHRYLQLNASPGARNR